MVNLRQLTLIGLLSAALVLDAPPLFADSCPSTVNDSVRVRPLEQAKLVTLDYQPGQSAVPSGVETLPSIDMTPLLAVGANTVNLTAVDGQDTAWVQSNLPCASSPRLVMIVKGHGSGLQTVVTPMPIPTYGPIPTLTPTATTMDAIIAPTPAAMHTDKIINTEDMPLVTEDATSKPWMSLLRRTLISLALLAVIWTLILGDVRSWWQGLRRLAQRVDIGARLQRMHVWWQCLLQKKREWLG